MQHEKEVAEFKAATDDEDELERVRLGNLGHDKGGEHGHTCEEGC